MKERTRAGRGVEHFQRASRDIPVTVIPDCAVGAGMDPVAMVLEGAQGFVENGGLIKKIGTLHVATAAQDSTSPLCRAIELITGIANFRARSTIFSRSRVATLCVISAAS
mmetsp:Transcript_16172/g.32778  ORF Transcript_16172/g.32778 Transcript_16172/m.32778 type:complete len:110 (-) Transcript_16172:611-940(-)